MTTVAAFSVGQTRIFDARAEADVGTISGIHPLPVGTSVLTTNGTYQVSGLRFVVQEPATLWLDVVRSQDKT